MEARSVEEIPTGDGWQYEPKWDGFRCIAFRDGEQIFLQSKAGQPLARYFPDIVGVLAALSERQIVLDGELVVPVSGALSFDELQLRLHPAASRVQKLAKAHPATYIVFDLLAANGRAYLQRPLRERRPLLEKFARSNFKTQKICAFLRRLPITRLPPSGLRKLVATSMGSSPNSWMLPTLRENAPRWSKVKQIRTADCVVGGFRYARASRVIGSLLLGLYGDDGLLHHVGFTSAFKASERRTLTKKFEALRKPPGFTGSAPGGPSRWSTERTGEWEPVDPRVVVEVALRSFHWRPVSARHKNSSLASR